MKEYKGAAGMDGQGVDDVAQHLESNLKPLLIELQEKRYQPQPVKRRCLYASTGGNTLLIWICRNVSICLITN